MKSTYHFSKILLVLACSGIYAAAAEDVNIFLANSSVTGARPNVLLVLDNAASNNSTITLLGGGSGDKLEMLRQVLNNIVDPLNSTYFPACSGGAAPRVPVDCVTRQEVSDLLKNINLGLMIGNPSGNGKGGYVRYHVRRMDVDANRTNLVGKINPGIPQANNAPYAKMMHESYQYFGAKPAYVGFDSNLYDPGAKNGATNLYVSPATADNLCADNYIIFVGNGGPDSGEENDSRTLLNSIGGVLTTDPVSFTPNNLQSSWFDEYARTLKKQDVIPGQDGIQNVTTYTIAVQSPAANNFNTNTMVSARELLKSAAALGGGEYFLASDGQKAMKAFVDLLQKFQPTNSVFASSTLPVSVNVRGTFLNQVYMGQFRPDGGAGPRWPGNLKQYKIAVNVNSTPFLADRNGIAVEDTVNGFIKPSSTSFWTVASSYWAFDPMGNPKSASDAPDGNIVEKGGAAQRLRQDFSASQATRKLYTCSSTSGCGTLGTALSTRLFNDANTTDITTSLLGAADATERTNIINWIRGQDNANNEDGNGVSTDIRARVHGDLLHSRPAVVNYNRYGNDSDIVVYYGTNDGIFYAVKGGQADTDGGEKWGMVFPEFFGQLKRLRDNNPDISTANPKPYFADGPVSVFQQDVNDDKKYVASPDGDKVYLYVGMRRGGRFAYALDVSDPNAPKYLWKISNSGAFAELGQTWSTLRPAKINGVSDPVVIFGAGYDPYVEDLLPAGTTNGMGRGIFVVNGRTGALIKHVNPTGMASVPADLAVLDRDGDGNFDRIYATDTKGNLWRVDIDDADPNNWTSYKLAALGGTGADARKFLNKPDVVFGATYDAILIGSGDREHPFETTVTNRFYMLKDKKVGLTGGLLCGASGAERACVESDLTDVTSDPFQNTTVTIPTGWYLTLSAGEKVVGSAITSFGTTIFGTNRPTPPEPGVCTSNLGEARLYAVGYEAGTATLNLDGVAGLAATDRFEVIKGGGFPPSPVASRVVIDGKEVDVVCSGAHCLKPPTSFTSSRRARTYWYINQ